MPRPVLQLWRFDESEYDRPNQAWVCGKQADGHACRIGPDAGGVCLATYECMPRKDGAHARCTRPESAGGKCSEGPAKDGTCAHAITKCHPVRSWKSKRRLASIAIALAALVATLVACFSRGPVANGFVSPGPLTPAHAAAAATCADCHDSAVTAGGLLAAIPGGGATKCLDCHRDAAGPGANHPHGSATSSSERTLTCASCHPEHRGERVEIARGGDLACRSCHPEADGSLAKHPEFTALGAGNARIHFDHTAKAHRTERCESCHVLDAEGRRRVLPGFDAACSRCHLEEIAKPTAFAWRDPSSVRREPDDQASRWESDLRALACRVPLAPGVIAASAASDADPMTLPPPVPAAAVTARTWLAGAAGTRVMPASFATGFPATGEWLAEGDSLSYRPLVHGDPVAKGWLDLVARHAGRKPRYKDDGGRCTVCHALDPAVAGVPAAMAWTGHRDESRVTRFSHRAHGEVACQSCHAAQDGMFAPVTKAACTTCHASGKASDGCLTCHGYHEVEPAVPAPIAETLTGAAACEGCHANASKAWAASTHGTARLDSDERRAPAQEIADKLGLRGGALAERCDPCHATGVTLSAGEGGTNGSKHEARITCEACHGAARAWIGVHADLSVADRAERSSRAGMRRAGDAFALADACVSCHVVTDRALVAAGHVSGSPMDAMLWSQGEVRHGFGDGCTGAETEVNREMPPQRRRALFVVGALLDLHHSLDADVLTTAGDHRDAFAARIGKASKKLRKAASADAALGAELEKVLAPLDALELDVDPAVAPSAKAVGRVRASARNSARWIADQHLADGVDALDGVIGAKIKGAPWTPPDAGTSTPP